MSRSVTVRELAGQVGGEVFGDSERALTGCASIETAGPADVVFVDSPKYVGLLAGSKAGAAILGEGMEPPPGLTAIRVRQPSLAMAKALEILCPRERDFVGVSPQAVVGKSVEIAEGVGIGPLAYVGDRARIGRGTEIHPGATIGKGVVVGEDCLIYSGAHIYHDTVIGNRVIIHSGAVIGADGFGFVQEKLGGPGASPDEPLRHRKMRQVGRVEIEDDVEIGANTTIDRSALHVTRIGRGTQIDNLVMVGHNCTVGRHCIIVAQAGISGSTSLGDYVTVAGQAGLAGHVKVGSRAVVGAQAGVTKDIPEGQIVLGSPAIDARQARKSLTLIDSLPEFKRAIAAHEKRLRRVEEKAGVPLEQREDEMAD
jgi:UDP-3-O-[3-hydroxymyristoyl] glucosamine N-acyltransferase